MLAGDPSPLPRPAATTWLPVCVASPACFCLPARPRTARLQLFSPGGGFDSPCDTPRTATESLGGDMSSSSIGLLSPQVSGAGGAGAACLPLICLPGWHERLPQTTSPHASRQLPPHWPLVPQRSGISIAGVPRLAPPPLSLGIPGIPLPPHMQDSEAAGSTSSWGLQVGSLPALSGGGLFRSGECLQAWVCGLPASKAPAHALVLFWSRRKGAEELLNPLQMRQLSFFVTCWLRAGISSLLTVPLPLLLRLLLLLQ